MLTQGKKVPSWQGVAFLAALGGGCLVFFGHVIFSGNLFCLRDLLFDEYPWREFAKKALLQGEMPFWNPYSSCGKPFLADPKAAVFYPGNVIFYLLPYVPAFKLFVFAHVFLAGACMYLLGREWRLGRAAALVAGIVYSFNGLIITRIEFPGALSSFLWLPLAFLALERMLIRASAGYSVILAMALAAQFLAGNTPKFYFTVLAIVSYFLVRLFLMLLQGKERSAAGRSLALFVLAAVVSLALVLVQLLPTFEAMRLSTLAGTEDPRPEMASISPIHFASLLVPSVFGEPGYANYWGRTLFEFSVGSFYVGILGLIFVSATIGRRPEGTRVPLVYLWGLLAVTLLLAAGQYTPVFDLAYALVPFYNKFRWPAKVLFLTVFAMSALAGTGAQKYLAAGGSRASPGSPLRSPALIFWFLLDAFLIVLAVWGYTNPDAARNLYRATLYTAKTGFEHMPIPFSALVAGYMGMLFFLNVSLVLVFLRFSGKLRSAPAAAALSALLFFDLFAHNAFVNFAAPSGVYTRVPEKVAALRAANGLFRIFRTSRNAQQALYGVKDVGLFEWGKEFLVGEISLTHGMFKVGGGGRLRIPAYELLYEVALRPETDGRLRTRILNLLNVKYVVSAEDPFAIIFRGASREVSISEDPGAFPRAFVVPNRIIEPDNEKAMKLLLSRSFDPLAVVILQEDPGILWAGPPEQAVAYQVESVRYTLNSVTLRVRLDASGFLVVTDTYYPGWKASVDGKPVKVYRGDGAFRCVPLAAGQQIVEFRYLPTTFLVGLAGTLGAMLALVLFVLIRILRRRRALDVSST